MRQATRQKPRHTVSRTPTSGTFLAAIPLVVRFSFRGFRRENTNYWRAITRLGCCLSYNSQGILSKHGEQPQRTPAFGRIRNDGHGARHQRPTPLQVARTHVVLAESDAALARHLRHCTVDKEDSNPQRKRRPSGRRHDAIDASSARQMLGAFLIWSRK
jgi:hypothetical protein